MVSAAVAQPVIRSSTPVLNSASYIGPELVGSGSGIAQGSIFALWGSGFGDPDSFSSATTFPLKTTLGGVSAQITVAGTTTKAIMLNVYYGEQINAILPSATPVGTGTITVSYGGQTSAPAPIVVAPNSFGIYAANSEGLGEAAATDPQFNKNSIINTFHPGDTVILWGTGLGPVTWDETADPSTVGDFNSSLPVATQVYVGNAPAVTGYHGRSGCCSGLDEIVFTVPSGVQGCYVPVSVQAGAVMSNFTSIAVANSGNTCSDSIMGQDMIADLAAGQTVDFGWIQLNTAYNGDFASATFSQYTPATATLASYGVSSGYCMATENTINGPFPNDLSLPTLDAGAALTVSGPTGTFSIPQIYPGFLPGSYDSELGSGTTRVLWADMTFTASNGTGGTQVGPFSNASVIVPPLAARFIDFELNSSVPRSSNLSLTWDARGFGDPNGIATLGGYSAVVSSTDVVQSYAQFFCTVPVAPGQFSIPSQVLSFLPPSSYTADGYPYGGLWFFQYGTPGTFTASGLTKGIITAGTWSLTGVGFK
jgi:uncharacterized protein (TIGR03437 family)